MTGIHETFGAPWGTALRVMSVILALVLFGIMALGLYRSPVGGWLWYAALVATPVMLLVAALLCMVRRYVLTADTLYVQRPGWVTRIDLYGLEAVAADAHAMVGSKRLFANGGLFVFAGRFRNSTLGVYRALVNDPNRAVVLQWPDRRMVISPDEPKRFVWRLSEMRGFEVGRPDEGGRGLRAKGQGPRAKGQGLWRGGMRLMGGSGCFWPGTGNRRE